MKQNSQVKTAEITGELHSFSRLNVDAAPDEFGVYALYVPGILIYIGFADEDSGTLRDWLQSHFSGAEGPCTRAASAFRCEVTDGAHSRARELLEEYARGHSGSLPRCNQN